MNAEEIQKILDKEVIPINDKDNELIAKQIFDLHSKELSEANNKIEEHKGMLKTFMDISSKALRNEVIREYSHSVAAAEILLKE